MKRVGNILLLISITFSFLISTANQLMAEKLGEKTTIENIWKNPDNFKDLTVSVQGQVLEFIYEESSTNSFYVLKGKYDGVIRVKVQFEEPTIGKKYIVTGTLYPDVDMYNTGNIDDAVFIHQTNITEIDDFYDWEKEIVNEQTPKEPKSGDDKQEIDYIFYAIIIAIIIVLIVIIIVVIKLLSSNKQSNSSNYEQPVAPVQNTSLDSSFNQQKVEDEFKTIKIVRDTNRTLKFIPGQLEIISGEDMGKSFRLAGYPSSDGSVTTMGTKEQTGDKRFAHILIDKKFRTVSRYQAEFIYRNSENKLYVKNISKVNFTKIDGTELKENEMALVKDGSVITTGELEFKYTS